MYDISNFQYIYESGDILKRKDLSVYQKNPVGISWDYMGKSFKRDNVSSRLHADISYQSNLIAIIEGPFTTSPDQNKAYIIDGGNNIIFNVAELFLEKNKDLLFGKALFFNGVSFDNGLYFFLDINNNGFRFQFNIETGEIGKLIESR